MEKMKKQHTPLRSGTISHHVWQTRKSHANQGLQTNRSATFMTVRETIVAANENMSKWKAKLALLDHQEFLATSAGTNIWTLEPAQLTRLVNAFTDWEKVNATNMVTGGNRARPPAVLPECTKHGASSRFLGSSSTKPAPTLQLQEHGMQLRDQGGTLDEHYIGNQTRVVFVPKMSDTALGREQQ